ILEREAGQGSKNLGWFFEVEESLLAVS
ncbi:MAG: hypothetical protein H6Q48_4142, partial [Deltaproteobacteria bacterium]|nr:hypothetical protein [Deltaproteobacteria bacterium]